MHAHIQLFGWPDEDAAFQNIEAALAAAIPELSVSKADGSDIAPSGIETVICRLSLPEAEVAQTLHGVTCTLFDVPAGYEPFVTIDGRVITDEESLLALVSRTHSSAIRWRILEAIPRKISNIAFDFISITESERPENTTSVKYGAAVDYGPLAA